MLAYFPIVAILSTLKPFVANSAEIVFGLKKK